MSDTPVKVEMEIIETCTNALSRIGNDQDTMNRVMRYLTSRFPIRQQRDGKEMFVPDGVRGADGVIVRTNQM